MSISEKERLALLAERVADAALDEGLPPSRIVTVQMIAGLYDAERAALARVGLVKMTNDVLSGRRNGGRGSDTDNAREIETVGDVDPPTHQPGRPHPRAFGAFMERLALVTSDGNALVRVCDMAVEELERAAEDFAARSASLGVRARALEFAAKTCRSNGVRAIRELGDGARRRVDDKLREAWGEGA